MRNEDVNEVVSPWAERIADTRALPTFAPHVAAPAVRRLRLAPVPASVEPVPQTDPGAAFRAQAGPLRAAFERVMSSGRYVLADEVEGFERELTHTIGPVEVVACASGTDALELALRACRLPPRAMVATVAHTAPATVAAIERAGHLPLLLDVDPVGCTLDVAELETALDRGAPIEAVVAVHLYGRPADLDALVLLCETRGIALIEDCAQAQGATHRGRPVGGFGRAAAFSFYPTKIVGAFGDGGAAVFREAADAGRARALRQYGWSAGRVCETPGLNSRLDELQAAFLRVRLAGLEAGLARRRAIAGAYDGALAGTATSAPAAHAGHAFHQYVIQVDDREAVRTRLATAGVATAVHYAPALHLHPAHRGRLALGPARCRVTERLAERVLSLPMFPELSETQVARVRAALRAL